MENTIPQLGSSNFPLNSSQYQSRCDPGGDYSNNISMHFNSLGALNAFSYKGMNRVLNNWNDIHVSENPLLNLGLGQSSNALDSNKMTPTTISVTAPVEANKKSVVDLELGFQDNFGSFGGFSHKSSVGSHKCSSDEDMFDLQLNLSTGPSESSITNVSPVSDCHDSLDVSVTTSPVPFNDEGSSSSCWIFGSYLGPISSSIEISNNPSSDKKICTKVNPAVVVPDLPSTIEQREKSPVACTSGFFFLEQKNNSTKKCQFQGCGKGARGASGLCIAHGGGRRCQKPGCQKGAEGRTIYCKSHGGGRRCEHLGCTKSAEGRTDFCIGHGGGRRCSHEGCSHAARGKCGLCIRHGGGKRCQMENCTKSAEGLSGLCISHGGGRRCQFPECTKGAQGSTMLCKAHGGGKRCTFLGCTKGAEGSTPFCKGHGGGKRCSFQGGICPKSVHGGTQFCVAHGGGKRCAVAECTKSARGRTNFCVRHGGGKRCKSEGCDKSAQGSTDFCKAHGGGKRCSWGHMSSQYGAGDLPCDKFARSKSGLCSSHNALLQDHCVHGSGRLSTALYNRPIKPENNDAVGHSILKLDNDRKAFNDSDSFDSKSLVGPLSTAQPGLLPFLEGRVHGVNLIAMLVDNPCESSNALNLVGGATSDKVAANSVMHRWM